MYFVRCTGEYEFKLCPNMCCVYDCLYGIMRTNAPVRHSHKYITSIIITSLSQHICHDHDDDDGDEWLRFSTKRTRAGAASSTHADSSSILHIQNHTRNSCDELTQHNFTPGHTGGSIFKHIRALHAHERATASRESL